MKKNCVCMIAAAALCLTIAGCGTESVENTGSIFEPSQAAGGGKVENESSAGKEQITATSESEAGSEQVAAPAEGEGGNNQAGATEQNAAPSEGGVSICDETSELDYNSDYEEEIKVAVERAVASATSFDDEFNQMGLIQDHITSRRSQDQTQVEMNMASFYYYEVWDAELNNLWGRFSETVDAATKEKALEHQRTWNALKQDVALEVLGPQDQGGSIYPLLYNTFMEESTKASCYYLAKDLSAASGRGFTIPPKQPAGGYVDTQGTDSIYSCLSVAEGWESGYDVKVSLYRQGELEGSAEESADTLEFTSYDDSVKGVIYYGWDGATFEVTEVNGDSIVQVGDTYQFPFVF